MAIEHDGLKQLLDDDTLYYVQDKRQNVGNCMLWWCVKGAGYCCEIRMAGLYTATEVRRMRDDVDVPWPAEFIANQVCMHVRRDTLRTKTPDA